MVIHHAILLNFVDTITKAISLFFFLIQNLVFLFLINPLNKLLLTFVLELVSLVMVVEIVHQIAKQWNTENDTHTIYPATCMSFGVATVYT